MKMGHHAFYLVTLLRRLVSREQVRSGVAEPFWRDLRWFSWKCVLQK